MDFIVSANTDIGIKKNTNQDSLSVKLINTSQGKMAFAILCDGMGGLDKGEVASAAVIKEFDKWVYNELPTLCNGPIEDYMIKAQWDKIIVDISERIKRYGARQGVNLGTTAVVMLLTQTRYYILNVGDSRAYEIKEQLKQITVDQTFIAREIALGHMTMEEAMQDSRRNVLLQCIGASDEVYPEMFFGPVQKDAAYMLCSDGFRHEITPEEIYAYMNPNVLYDETSMNNNTVSLIELNKQRMETDNISVALIRTF
ncbi:MAG: PP2C family serine/threonine-protein phosphatase [Lachnospiraceae bacterium]|nr:PP2C family serine/threonine-protein phosphatase [Lachnospiraceae bacterium]